MQNHCFNILTFSHPQEELTLYFTKVEDETLTRVYHSLVPDEVIERFGQQEHYYISFAAEKDGFYPVTIKYPEMVAEMLPHFDGNEIPEFGKDNLWFL